MPDLPDPHLASLLSRADGPFAAGDDGPDRLARLFAPLPGVARGRLAALLHGGIDRGEPHAPLLATLEACAVRALPGSVGQLLLELEGTAAAPRLLPLLLRGIRTLLTLDPAAVPPWLLLVRLFREAGRSVRDLADAMPLLLESLSRERPGDIAAKLLHVAAALAAHDLPPPLLCRALVELARGPVTLPSLVRRLFGLFAPPGLPAAETDGAARLGCDPAGALALAPGAAFLALPLDLREGILPPGALRLRDEQGEIVSAGYRHIAREGRFTLEAESPRGEVAHRPLLIRLDPDAPPRTEPRLTDPRYLPEPGERFDALHFLCGFLAGFADPAPDGRTAPVDRAALLRASQAYASAARESDLARALAPVPPPLDPPAPGDGTTTIIY